MLEDVDVGCRPSLLLTLITTVKVHIDRISSQGGGRKRSPHQNQLFFYLSSTPFFPPPGRERYRGFTYLLIVGRGPKSWRGRWKRKYLFSSNITATLSSSSPNPLFPPQKMTTSLFWGKISAFYFSRASDPVLGSVSVLFLNQFLPNRICYFGESRRHFRKQLFIFILEGSLEALFRPSLVFVAFFFWVFAGGRGVMFLEFFWRGAV